MAKTPTPQGDVVREAIDALRGYVYQLYQSALALVELEPEEFLFLEVAEDYAIVAGEALNAVQVKETKNSVTINSDDIVTSINSFVDLRQKNPELKIRLRHLTTSKIGKEKESKHRIGNIPTLEAWRTLAKMGDLAPLRKILENSKLSKQTKKYLRGLDDNVFREDFLKRIHFDCGALESKYLLRQLHSKLFRLMKERGGAFSQVDGCLSSILMTLLHKAIQKDDRFVDRNTLEELLEKATQIPVNRAQYEAQSQLISKALAGAVSKDTNLVPTRLSEPKLINEVPLPAVIASRTIHINNIKFSLSQYGVCWIYGAAGVGKTIGAKIAARRLGGNWASINLRGLNADQVYNLLLRAIDTITEKAIGGLIVDDFECPFEPQIIDVLSYLRVICERSDLLLVYISPRLPSSDFLFSANLTASIEQKFEEFTEQDLVEILTGLGVHEIYWARYIYTISGGGHPQLAIAAIQSMQNNGWDINELKTLNSFLNQDTAVEQVRARTRERLLNELPDGARKIIERLSLKPGSFRRSFVLDMALITPTIPDAGIVFEGLIGSWVDQQERDRFSLSPLLTNFAVNTLTVEQKREIYFEIANSLTKGRLLDPIEANSALLAAWSGKNASVIVKLCLAVLGADQNEIKMLAPHLMVFSFIRTDTYAYDEEPAVSQMFRGVQLILACQNETMKDNIKELLQSFEKESERVEDILYRNYMKFAVYVKLLLVETTFGEIPNFLNLLSEVDKFLENVDKEYPSEMIEAFTIREKDGVPLIGFLFINQVRQVTLIDELLPIFESLNSCSKELRGKLLMPFSNPEYGFEMLVSGAWLSEHNANTIDTPRHSEIYAHLEAYAKSWEYIDLAVCCRKYRSVIIDEYGGDKEQALSILDEGMELYGDTNSVLVRAKAMVLYRAGDHQGSLVLSKMLIEGNAPLSKTEK